MKQILSHRHAGEVGLVGDLLPEGLGPVDRGVLSWARLDGRATFFAERYLRRPWIERGGVGTCFDVWAMLGHLLPTSCEVQAMRESQPHPEGRPDALRTARAWHALGWSLIARRAHEHEPRLASLAEEFSTGLDGRVEVQLSTAPRMSRSGWHLDPEEIFLLQASGKVIVRLRENTSCPQPLHERMPSLDAFAHERGAVTECTLAAGDWLYIPGGWWHNVHASSDSCSVPVRVMALSPIEALDCLRDHLLRCHAARARLPPSGRWTADLPASNVAAAAISAIADLVSSRLQDPAFVHALPALVRQRERVAIERRARQARSEVPGARISAGLRSIGA